MPNSYHDEGDHSHNSDIDFTDFKPEVPASFHDVDMDIRDYHAECRNTDQRTINVVNNEENKQYFNTKSNTNQHNSMKIVPDFFGSQPESKPITDISTMKSNNMKYMMYNMSGHIQSLPDGMGEQFTTKISASLCDIKKEDNSPNTYKYSMPSSSFDERPLEKKSKQERNRESAKKCRQRKKEYLIKLEAELRSVREELALCKHELEVIKGDMFCKIEKEFVSLKKDLLSQAETVINNGLDTSSLDELLSKLTVYYF